MTAVSANQTSAMETEGHRAEKSVGAVVVGGDYQGLGIVRSLGRQGVPVCVVDDEHSIARFSRYATHGVQVSNLRDEIETVKTLLEVGNRLGLKGWVLFPTRDELVAAFSRHRAELSELFLVPTPDWNTIQWVWDKSKTYQLAMKLGIPIPQTWFPRTLEDLDRIVTPFPVALKPAIKEHFFYATKAKAWRAGNPAELRDLFQRALAVAGPGGVLVQDLIPGDGSHQFAHCAFFKDGKAIGSMEAQRKRQHPHDFGRASTYVETVDMPALATMSAHFLNAINYYGLVEVEFKLDPRDRQYKLLDVNARTWGYHSLGLNAGVDFSYLLHSDLMGQSVKPCRARAGVSWIRTLTDLPTGVMDIFQGRLTLRNYMRTLRSVNEDAVFSREDPLPGLVECALLPYLTLKKGF